MTRNINVFRNAIQIANLCNADLVRFSTKVVQSLIFSYYLYLFLEFITQAIFSNVKEDGEFFVRRQSSDMPHFWTVLSFSRMTYENFRVHVWSELRMKKGIKLSSSKVKHRSGSKAPE
jgi:hypothetical protein